MKSMFEQLQQVKQQMTNNVAEKAARTTSAHKVQSGQKGAPEKMTAWQRAQQAKKTEAPRQRKAVPAAVKAIEGTKSGKPLQPGERRKNRQRKTNRKKLEKLVSFWPDAFDLDKPRPLALGIDAAIRADMDARDIGCKGMVLFTLGRYAMHRKYLEALVAGGPRYELNGNPCGEVTPEEQKRAAEQLAAMKDDERQKKAGQSAAHTGDAIS